LTKLELRNFCSLFYYFLVEKQKNLKATFIILITQVNHNLFNSIQENITVQFTEEEKDDESEPEFA
jgi:hypothetical protein